MSKGLSASSCRVLQDGFWLAQFMCSFDPIPGCPSQGEYCRVFTERNLTLKLVPWGVVGVSLCPGPRHGQGHDVDKELLPLTCEVWPWTLRDLKNAWLPVGCIYYPWILQNKIYLSYAPSWVSGLCVMETSSVGMKQPEIHPFGRLILKLLLPAGL